MAGLFIAFEGGEGAGKTTQSQLLVDRLAELDIPCLLVREPGGTELGEYLRDYLKSERPLSPEAELLLFEAARVELVTTRIQPALDSGVTVIADRFYGSTVAYQGYGRGLDTGVITSLNKFATWIPDQVRKDGAGRELAPHLTILLDLTPEVGLKRTAGRQMAFSLDPAGGLAPLHRTEEGTRFEDLDLEFHRRAQQGFLDQARDNPAHWVVIDAGQSVETVASEVWGMLQERLEAATRADPATGADPSAPDTPQMPQGELWPQASEATATGD